MASTIYAKVVGISFKDLSSVNLSLGGKVNLVHSPFKEGDKEDPFAVKVMYEGKQLGWIQAKPHEFTDSKKPLNQEVVERGITEAIVCDLWWGTDDNLNQEGQGDVCSVKLKIDGFGRYREKDGKKYESITTFLGRIPELTDGLDDWWENYLEIHNPEPRERVLKMFADKGNIVHDVIHSYLRLHNKGQILDDPNNGGRLSNFLSEFSPQNIVTEEEADTVVYDDDLMLSGQYDWEADFKTTFEPNTIRAIVDDKSSSSVRYKHELQAAFYGHCKGLEWALVVAWGSKNKKGYQAKWVHVPTTMNDLVKLHNQHF